MDIKTTIRRTSATEIRAQITRKWYQNTGLRTYTIQFFLDFRFYFRGFDLSVL